MNPVSPLHMTFGYEPSRNWAPNVGYARLAAAEDAPKNALEQVPAEAHDQKPQQPAENAAAAEAQEAAEHVADRASGRGAIQASAAPQDIRQAAVRIVFMPG